MYEQWHRGCDCLSQQSAGLYDSRDVMNVDTRAQPTDSGLQRDTAQCVCSAVNQCTCSERRG